MFDFEQLLILGPDYWIEKLYLRIYKRRQNIQISPKYKKQSTLGPAYSIISFSVGISNTPRARCVP